jgi:DNA repair exonuclease SbcCD ATPase subunit
MDIKFKKLHIENFMSIGEADIDLSDRAFTLIEGVNNNENDNARSNGSGKSSIFESLVWALTGTTMRGNKDIVNFNGNDGALVTLEFIVDNDKFVITRTKDHSKHKTNLFIEINGVDKSGKGIRDSEKLLAEYLPDLTSSLIGSVIVLGQGLPQKFTNNSPSGRKEVLEKLFKSDYMIQDLKDRISIRKGELNEELRKVQDSKLVALTRLENIIDTINLNNAKLKQLQEQNSLEFEADMLHKEILEIEERQIQLKDEIDTYTIKRDEANTKISSAKIRKAEIIAEIDKDYESTKEFANDGINTCKVKLNLAKNELDKVKNIKDICPTCGQKLPEVHKPDLTPYEKAVEDALADLGHWNEQLDKIKFEIEAKKVNSTKELESNITIYEKESIECSLKVDELKNRYSNNDRALTEKRRLFDENMSLQQTRHIQIQQLLEDIEKKETLKSNEDVHINNLQISEEEINNRLGIINKFNTVITRDFRGYLLNDIIVYINKKAKEYCELVFGTQLIDFTLSGNNLLISYNNKEYEALSGGERQKVDLIIQFAMRDMLCKHTSFSSNIIVLDEIFDNLDDVGCQKILDLITTRLYDISSIFIITHHGAELSIPYDGIIKIEKSSDGISRVGV